MAEHNLKLLGETVKAFRQRADLSQFRLAYLMHWEGTAPIVAIEKGGRRPRPDTLKSLSAALGLSPAETNYLYGLAGYLQDTVLPPLQQIRVVLDEIEEEIRDSPYPAYVVDYKMQFWVVNAASSIIVGGTLDDVIRLIQRKVRSFDIVFDSRLGIRDNLANIGETEEEQVLRFKAYNMDRRHEKFYMSYPEDMKERLIVEDYLNFESAWKRVDVGMKARIPVFPSIGLRIKEDVLAFSLRTTELLHLNRQFILVCYEPQERVDGNKERCSSFFENLGFAGKECIKIWDYRDDLYD